MNKTRFAASYKRTNKERDAMDNKANRIAKTLRAKARRAKVKSFKRIPKREDFRQRLLARIANKERFDVK